MRAGPRAWKCGVCVCWAQVLRAALQGAGQPQPQRRRAARGGHPGGGLCGPAVCYGTWEIEEGAGDVMACRASFRPANHPQMRPVRIDYRLRLWGTAAAANNRCRSCLLNANGTKGRSCHGVYSGLQMRTTDRCGGAQCHGVHVEAGSGSHALPSSSAGCRCWTTPAGQSATTLSPRFCPTRSACITDGVEGEDGGGAVTPHSRNLHPVQTMQSMLLAIRSQQRTSDPMTSKACTGCSINTSLRVKDSGALITLILGLKLR
jgi:hypothetical protein